MSNPERARQRRSWRRTLTAILVGGALLASPSAGLAEEPPSYDLRPFSDAAPPLAAAWSALDASAPAERRADALVEVEAWQRSEGSSPDAVARLAASWLRASLLGALGRTDEARQALEELRQADSTLADEARRTLAEDLAASGDAVRGAELLFEVLAGTEEHEAGCVRACELLRGAGEVRRAAELVDELRGRPLAWATRGRMELLAADLWSEAGEADRAAELLFDLWWRHGDDTFGERARKRLERMKRGPAFGDRIARSVLGASRGKAKKLRKTLKRKRARSLSARQILKWGDAVLSRFDPKHRERGLKTVVNLLQWAKGRRFEPYATFGHAAILRTLDRDVEAAGVYLALAERFPKHPLTEEAQVEAAGLLALRGFPLEADEVYRRVAEEGRPGEPHREALWQHGFEGIRRGEPRRAAGVLTRLVSRYGGDRYGNGATWAERGGYWLARARELDGDAAAARVEYAAIIARFPLSWYAILAAARLGIEPPAGDEAGPSDMPEAPVPEDTAAAAPIPAGGVAAGAPAGDATASVTLDDLSVLRRPSLDLPIVWLRLGEEDRARDGLHELLRSGRLPGSARALLARLHERAGNERLVNLSLKYAGVLVGRPGPEGVSTYDDLFPIGYTEDLVRYAESSGVAPGLLAGLVSVESRFKANARSGAGAVGLLQMLPNTAKKVARVLLGKAVSRSTLLKDPVLSLEVGSRWVRELLEHFRDHPVPALAAYNAGDGATRGWLRRRGHLEADAFVEAIPYPQTRHYVMRIISMSEVYRTMHALGGPRVELPMTLPVALGPLLEEQYAEQAAD